MAVEKHSDSFFGGGSPFSFASAISAIRLLFFYLHHYKDVIKDDYIYISYKEQLKCETDSWGFKNYVNYDVCVCGNDIVDMVLAAEKYSGFDITEVRAGIEEKRVWLRDNEPEYYVGFVGEDKDIFTLWKEKGYI